MCACVYVHAYICTEAVHRVIWQCWVSDYFISSVNVLLHIGASMYLLHVIHTHQPMCDNVNTNIRHLTNRNAIAARQSPRTTPLHPSHPHAQHRTQTALPRSLRPAARLGTTWPARVRENRQRLADQVRGAGGHFLFLLFTLTASLTRL